MLETFSLTNSSRILRRPWMPTGLTSKAASLSRVWRPTQRRIISLNREHYHRASKTNQSFSLRDWECNEMRCDGKVWPQRLWTFLWIAGRLRKGQQINVLVLFDDTWCQLCEIQKLRESIVVWERECRVNASSKKKTSIMLDLEVPFGQWSKANCIDWKLVTASQR